MTIDTIARALGLAGMLAITGVAAASCSTARISDGEGTPSAARKDAPTANMRTADAVVQCRYDWDCPNGVCVMTPGGFMGTCASYCQGEPDCMAGWTCAPYQGSPRYVCRCDNPHPETCNGFDDDCNGIIDDPGPADAQCELEDPGSACVAGHCAPCPLRCFAACVDPMTDPHNCGACGNTCRGGTTCVAGACECTAGETRCGQSCVDVQTDPNNCGGCGTHCGDRFRCEAGSCQCPAPSIVCGNACIDAQTDNDNCGACGNACTGGTTCTAGACTCPVGETLCAGRCVNTQNDLNNCGACGNVCTASNPVEAPVCSAGRCIQAIATADVPSDLQVDATHLYWLEGHAGNIKRIPREGGLVEILAAGQANARGLGIGGGQAFWAAFEQSIWRMPVTPLPSGFVQPRFLFAFSNASAATGTATRAFAVGGVFAIGSNYAGTPLSTFSHTEVNATETAATSDAFVWIDKDAGTVKRIGFTGGTIMTLVGGIHAPHALAVSDVSIFAAAADWGGSVVRIGPQGGGPVWVAIGQRYVMGVGTDGVRMAWSTEAGEVYVAPVNGTNPILVANMYEPVLDVEVAGTRVFFATRSQIFAVDL